MVTDPPGFFPITGWVSGDELDRHVLWLDLGDGVPLRLVVQLCGQDGTQTVRGFPAPPLMARSLLRVDLAGMGGVSAGCSVRLGVVPIVGEVGPVPLIRASLALRGAGRAELEPS